MNKKKRITILEQHVKLLQLTLLEHHNKLYDLQKEQNLPGGPLPKLEPLLLNPPFKLSKSEIKKIKDSLENINLPKKKRKCSNQPDFDIEPPPFES